MSDLDYSWISKLSLAACVGVIELLFDLRDALAVGNPTVRLPTISDRVHTAEAFGLQFPGAGRAASKLRVDAAELLFAHGVVDEASISDEALWWERGLIFRASLATVDEALGRFERELKRRRRKKRPSGIWNLMRRLSLVVLAVSAVILCIQVWLEFSTPKYNLFRLTRTSAGPVTFESLSLYLPRKIGRGEAREARFDARIISRPVVYPDVTIRTTILQQGFEVRPDDLFDVPLTQDVLHKTWTLRPKMNAVGQQDLTVVVLVQWREVSDLKQSQVEIHGSTDVTEAGQLGWISSAMIKSIIAVVSSMLVFICTVVQGAAAVQQLRRSR